MLHLFNNQLETFDLKVVQTRLEYIELSHNQFREIPIIHSTNRFDLVLNSNQIRILNLGDLSPNIKSLALNSNQLIGITGTKYLPNLLHLALRDNPDLRNIPIQVLKAMPNLQDLDLRSLNLSEANQRELNAYCHRKGIQLHL